MLGTLLLSYFRKPHYYNMDVSVVSGGDAETEYEVTLDLALGLGLTLTFVLLIISAHRSRMVPRLRRSSPLRITPCLSFSQRRPSSG